ncbi:MAG: hypothetical protein AB1644_13095 [Candidatus Zixiibacteriota bacterium]
MSIRVSAVVLLSGSLLAIAASAPGETGQFAFAPPDSVSYQVSAVTARSRTADTAAAILDSALLSGEGTLTRTASGWALREKSAAISMKRDGETVDDPLLNILVGLTVTTEIDSIGTAIRVEGYDAIIGRIDSSMSSDQATMVKRLINPDAIAKRDLEEWNGRMLRLRGRSTAIGSVSYDTTTISFPNGTEALAYCATQVKDTLRINGILCARVAFTTDVRIGSLCQAIGVELQDICREFEVSDSLPEMRNDSAAQMHANVESVVEVATMLFRSEISSRKISFLMPDRSGTKVPMSMMETIRKAYLYAGR